MKGKTLKYIIFLATISIAGIFLIQFAFLRSSYNFSEKQFRESTSVALKEVAWQILLAGGNSSNFDSITPVEIVSGNYYLVNVGTAVDKELLKLHLTEQLKKHEIYTDFEFAIFDPESEQMEFRTLITTEQKESPSDFEFATNENYINYFGVHFPNRSAFFNSQLSIWYFLTGLLVIVVLFFGYTLSVIIRQRQLSEVQKNFINNLTHELKTPISSIALAASVINNEEIFKTPKRLFEYARIIQEQNKRLSKNVEKVLNLASLEKNRIHLNLKEINLQFILQETIKQFEQTDFGQKAKIEFQLNDITSSILADKFHFSHLILNILENAVKYCEKTPSIKINLTENKKVFELSFSDNGIGILKDQRKKIFTKFYRVPTGNVHNVKGFGLGLDYVQKIVIAHKWKIKVDENTNGGSIFTLSIPNKK
ncbi:MAG: HAMP domain-containing histidine kinase [Bacteroidetes bacterium]|nr:HAMP domain-containing histidine kinase [Bacteroidota bacterium]